MFSIERTLGPQKIATLALGLLKGEGGHAYAKTSLGYNTSDACPIQLGALFAREGFSRLIHCSTTGSVLLTTWSAPRGRRPWVW